MSTASPMGFATSGNDGRNRIGLSYRVAEWLGVRLTYFRNKTATNHSSRHNRDGVLANRWESERVPTDGYFVSRAVILILISQVVMLSKFAILASRADN